MLNWKNVQVFLQNFGSVFGVFLMSQDKTAIEQRFYSFWNQKITGGELEWWSDSCALFWVYSSHGQTAEDKILWGLKQAALRELLPPANSDHKKGRDCWPQACETAIERFRSIERVNWYKTNATEVKLYDYTNSRIKAERDSGNFDDVLAAVLTRNGPETLDMIKARRSDGEENFVEPPEEKEPETVDELNQLV